jgi:hypothetical protein
LFLWVRLVGNLMQTKIQNGLQFIGTYFVQGMYTCCLL